MTDRASSLALVRAAVLPAGLIGVTAYFAFHAVAGGTGVLAWQRYKAQRIVVEREAAQAAADKAVLARQVRLLDPRHVDKDLADELVRRDLGVVRSDEVILPLPDAK